MLKTTGLSEELTLKAFRADANKVVGGDSSRESIKRSRIYLSPKS